MPIERCGTRHILASSNSSTLYKAGFALPRREDLLHSTYTSAQECAELVQQNGTCPKPLKSVTSGGWGGILCTKVARLSRGRDAALTHTLNPKRRTLNPETQTRNPLGLGPRSAKKTVLPSRHQVHASWGFKVSFEILYRRV